MSEKEIRDFIGKKVMLRYINKAGKINNIACNILVVKERFIEVDLLENYRKTFPIKLVDIKEIKTL